MGNRVYAASLSLGIIGILCSILLISPTHASAAIFWPGFPFANDSDNGQTKKMSAQLVQRLCDRQSALGNRLSRFLIDPEICNPTPPEEPTLSFSADPSTIDEGESSVLEWSTTNATSCTASDGWSGSKATSGDETVSPDQTTTYTLSCSGPGGDVEESVTVTVEDAPLPTPSVTLSADPTNVLPNGTSTLTWDSSNANACVASDGWSGSKNVDGSEQVSLSATTTYTILCGNGVSTSTDSVTVNVGAHPTPAVTLAAEPTSVTPGAGSASSTLTWTSTDATSCTASGGAWTGPKALSGSEIVTPSATTTYQLDCTGPGGVGSDDAIVDFVPAASTPSPTLTFTADPTSVTPGAGTASSTLTWSSSNASACEASGGWSGTRGLSGTEIVQPDATTTYTLLCGNGTASTSESVTVDFVPTPAPSVDHLLISEVSYDVDTAHGTTGSPDDNEWIELYNPTDSVIDLSNWWIADASNEDKLPNGTTIAAGGFLVITSASTTSGFWGGTPMVSIEGPLGNSLGNDGDALSLLNANGATTTVDALSWGNNVSVFTLPDVDDGHSLVRLNLNADTDTAADWTDDATPAPGEAN